MINALNHINNALSIDHPHATGAFFNFVIGSFIVINQLDWELDEIRLTSPDLKDLCLNGGTNYA